jgi:hypothetical protein
MSVRALRVRIAAPLMFVGSLLLASGHKHLPDFQTPPEFWSDPDYHPVGYLKSYHVEDAAAVLKPEQRERLRRLFLAAYDACKEKYHQDYLIGTDVPLYRLLRTNYPDVSKAESEGGRMIFLGRISRILRPSDESPPEHP